VVESVENLPDHAVVNCSDDSTYDARVVVGADGLHSNLRPMVSDDPAINSGYVAYRGTVELEKVEHDSTLDNVVVWLGPGLHLVQYPLGSDRSLYNQVAVFRSDEYTAGRTGWGGPEELERRFAGTRPEVRGALSALGKDRRWEMWDRRPLDRWSAGRVVLIGDAAHPMLQYLAQGSCQALEDGVALAAALDQHADAGWSSGAVEKAFSAYESVRVSRASRVQRIARVWGDIWHVDGIAMSLRDEAFSIRRIDDYRHIDWLYGPPFDQAADWSRPPELSSIVTEQRRCQQT
jgi:salicylate hydroxylase